jgi:hypothetical protein
MTQHNQRNHPWRWAFVLGAVGLLLGSPALAQVTPPSPLIPLTKFSITGKTSGSETTDTRAADYSLRFTLAPARSSTPRAPPCCAWRPTPSGPSRVASLASRRAASSPTPRESTRCPTTAAYR